MALIRTLFWTVIFLGATFAFTVLFEHGPTNFSDNAKKEAETIRGLFGAKVEKRKDDTDRITPPLH